MSYILDALRKADAQRQRTRLPGLDAQPPSVVTAGSGSGWWRSPIAWAAGGALLVLGVVLAWPGAQSPASMPPVTTVAVQERAPAVVAPPPPAEATAPVAAAAIQPAPPPPRPEPKVAPRPVAARSTPDRAAAPAAAASTVAAASPVPSDRAGAAPAAPSSAAKTPAPAAESSSPPPGAPKLAISGGVYSTSVAQRLLIVGGQVFNEGSEVAPGVVLVQVRPNQALLSYQGQRYTVRY